MVKLPGFLALLPANRRVLLPLLLVFCNTGQAGASEGAAEVPAAGSPSPGTLDAASAPEVPSAPALPAPPDLPVPIQAEATTWDGQTIPLAPDGENAPIPPQVHFRLHSERALLDLRIKLVDESGRLVPTRDRATVGAGTTYEIRPVEALITGTRYRLQVGGQLQAFARDVEGTSYGAVSFDFLTDGEKPPPPPKVRAKRRR